MGFLKALVLLLIVNMSVIANANDNVPFEFSRSVVGIYTLQSSKVYDADECTNQLEVFFWVTENLLELQFEIKGELLIPNNSPAISMGEPDRYYIDTYNPEQSVDDGKKKLVTSFADNQITIELQKKRGKVLSRRDVSRRGKKQLMTLDIEDYDGNGLTRRCTYVRLPENNPWVNDQE
jgi:hypothetical protein